MQDDNCKFAEDHVINGCSNLGLQDDVKVMSVHGYRWTLDYEQSLNHPDFGKNMIKLEIFLQEKLGRPIDLRLEATEDKNRRKQRNVLWSKPNETNSVNKR